MTTYALTISTAELGLGILSNARVTVKRKRTVVSDTFPSADLSSQETVTNASGIATILLAADDGTVFHEVRIYNSRDMVIYFKALIMPPQAVSIADLPVQDIISAAAADAAAAAAAAAAASIVLDTKKFNTYAEQMAYTGNYIDGQKADVLGYDKAGDGGYIQMYWSASSTAEHNKGTVRQPTAISGAGRWLAVDTSYINVKQFGAVGDGDTDDTAAFLAAIANSRTIYVPDGGTYIVSGILSLNDNTAFVGIGSPTIKKKNNDTNAHCIFFISSKKNVSFSALTLDGNGANQTAYASSNKAVVEVWNDSANIQFNSVVIQNGYKWNMYLKGNSDAGAPSGVVLTNSSTKGALGFVGGIAAADGNTGIACIGADLKAVNCNFFDRVDLEPNTSAQTVDANFSNCKFFMMLDSSINGLYGSLTVSGCTFYAQPNLPCVQIYGGTINGNVFEGVKQGVVLATEWYGIIVLGNNNRGTMIVGNKINNATIGIGFAGPIESSIVGNAVVCNAVDNNAVVYNGFTLPKGGIVSVADSAYRDFICNSNRVRITEDFHSAGGFGINFMSNDSRGSSFVGNAVLRTGQQKGKMQASVSRYYASIVSGNAADVYTGVTGDNLISSFTPSKTELEPRNAPPTTGTWIIGDYAPSNNPANIGTLGWVCTLAGTDTNATWTKVGLLGATKAGQVNDSVATDTAQLNAKINELLARLRAAGLLVP